MTVETNSKLDEIIKTIENMTVVELSELVKALEERFGVTAAIPVGAGVSAQGPTASGGPAQAEEVKTTFDVILAGAGDKKIQVIKEIRAITNLGLKEAKDLVEGAPKEVKKGTTKEEAEDIKKKLEAAGAKVELK